MLHSFCHDLSFPVTTTSRGTGLCSSQSSGQGDPALMSRAVLHSVVPLHAHTWTWQLEDFTVLPAPLKVPADAVAGSSHPLASCCCGLFAASRTWGVPRVLFPTLCSLSKGAGTLPAPLAPPCAQGMVPSPLFCYIPPLRKMVTLGQTPFPLLHESSPGSCLGSALVRGVQGMLAGADELPALQRGRGHRKGAEWLCAHVCLGTCSHYGRK